MIRALDTNIFIRLFIGDNKDQAETARQMFDDGVLILPTVLLEVVWVLESRYRFSPIEIAERIESLLALPRLRCLDRDAVVWALGKFRTGADFADMLHLALARSADVFATFDQRVERHASGSPVPVETLR